MCERRRLLRAGALAVAGLATGLATGPSRAASPGAPPGGAPGKASGDVPGTSGDVPGTPGDVRGTSGDVPVTSGDVRGMSGDVPGTPSDVPGTSGEALARLRAGNAAWVGNRAVHPDAGAARRHDLAGHQDPFAVVFACIDSRVPPELVFDQGLGDLLVVRTAAHTRDPLVTGSLEYGPAELGTGLLLVLGHQRCGAVTAAVRAFREGVPLPGHLAEIGRHLRAPYEEVVRRGGPEEGLVEAVVREQTRRTVAALRADGPLAPLVEAGRLAVVGGHYTLDSGAVEFSV